MSITAELQQLLRPAGGGVYLVSSGLEEQIEMQRTIYGAATPADIVALHQASLEAIRSAKAFLLAVPSDVGAGFLRGANMGPAGLRAELLKRDPSFYKKARARGLLDLGDVFVVPQLLHDSMLSEDQLLRSRAQLYPGSTEGLPVSPLSISERALDLIFSVNPQVRPILLGGDHSNAWPLAASLARIDPEIAIVQVDAHTDMLEERLGVKYCFATWSYHASRLLKDPSRLVQFGIRASRFHKEHWESKYGIRQFWADECVRDPKGVLSRIVEHFKEQGVKRIYFSNDIDGTDIAFADATGTPEPDGLSPEFVLELIATLEANFTIIAGDIMEVAPPIERLPGGRERTLATATSYLLRTIDAVLQ